MHRQNKFASGSAAIPLDTGAVRRATVGRGDFNPFDGVFCDAFGAALPACLFGFLADLLAVAGRVFAAAGVLADTAVPARAAFPMGGFGDFLRVFLDIRLPFVAFAGSIIGVLRVVSRRSNRADRWANLMASE